MSRYDITGSEGEYQPGSDNKVLRNLPGISDPEEMNIAETDLLKDLTSRYSTISQKSLPSKRFVSGILPGWVICV